jgi:Mlc titration factor MtfA (ptsG expression regulator)
MITAIIFFCFFAAVQILQYTGQKDKLHRAYTGACPPPEVLPSEILLHGKDLVLTIQEIDSILKKRFKYYALLEKNLQERFIKRLHRFMLKKTFIIKDDEGFKEMPVLVSAAAIGLTFGLKDFRLAFYKYIRIYPEEYISENCFKVLAGNVQDNIITIAWNHLLKGYNDFTDGSNVGLHEMSHALYIQKIVIEHNYANRFLKKYNYLVNECRQAYNMEVEGKKNFYSEYADSDLQEFWAESVELFFEKPLEFNHHYPDVYKALKLLLNQDPLNKAYPLLESSLPYNKKLLKIIRLLRNRIIPGNSFN